ncbi:DUF887-domain-containing protein [Hyphopichia burtonii NRRL Y-1933]|uniref:DUF887-domain-containing protein n=1 Tax=Hyphopichia burtonii NRRL Y-1933 TaxID=984485 RepID=A0A1E4RKA3_9ASCO|nr:DUF887-domain-containing protein [Hyphopichia burtonii NRRL Y-1933]ODV67673.1 DUF887-domain-containing protein [Hyphopichia burtonii NRRL Y-1933]
MGIFSFLPVFEQDHLLPYRPFPAEVNGNLFLAHWHEMVLSFILYRGIQFGSSVISPKLLGKTYTGLTLKTRVNFDIHVVSMVQCIFSILIILPMWNHESWQNRVEDPYLSIYHYTPYGGFVAAVTIGYFIWDMVVCLQYYRMFGLGFLFHAFAALYVFGTCLIPYCMPWIPAFLLFELSTPFVNINWFALRLPAGTISDTATLINGLFLLASFFLVRIVWGFYAVAVVAIDMYKTLNQTNILIPAFILSLNGLLDILNVFWFYKMVMIAKKKASGGKKPKQMAKEVEKIE